MTDPPFMSDRLGTDLLVLAAFAASDATAADVGRRVRVAPRILPDGGVDGRDLVADLVTCSTRENLAQALVLRLLTPVGSLAPLGHAAYGSRLHELIGRGRNDTMRLLCRAFVLEAVAQEPRVDPAAVSLSFDVAAESLDTFVVRVEVRPHDDGDTPIALTLDVGV